MSGRTNLKTSVLVAALSLAIVSTTFAGRVIYVDDDGPADFNNIQAAIDDSIHGDIIVVNPGIYTGDGNRDIDYNGKAITVRGIDPNDPNIVAATVIDCNGTEYEPHRGFLFNDGEEADSILDGLTITNGYASYGSGICCEGSCPTMINCTISGNSAGARGGGMYNRDSNPTLTNCTFSGNSTNYGGGGMYNYHGDPTLTNCTFSGNSANFGGGMGNYGHSPTITDCMFINNVAEEGGGIWNDSGSPRITNCIFFRNSAYKYAGGMYEEDSAHSILTNCIFTENFAGYYGGGAIRIYDSDPILTNCTISGNYTSGKGGGIFNDYSGVLAVVTNSILWGNEDVDGMHESAQIHIAREIPIVNYTCIQGLSGNLGGIGNIDADPCFVSPGYWDDWHPPYGISGWIDSDYHLLHGSPCIDAGDPYDIPEPNETDLDGKPRVLDGNEDGIPIVDMGAYEYRPLISAEARIVPRTINLQSTGKWITAFLWLPTGYDVADIDGRSLFLEGQIQPVQFWVNEEKQVAMARFNRSEVQGILDASEVELTITGQLTDGTIFEAKDVIVVINKGSRKSAK